MITLPFSHEAFLEVFGAYNTRLWPGVLLLWILTAAVAWQWLRRRTVSRRLLFGLLAVHWAVSGVAYHWLFFREINPAARFFAPVFVVQALCFARLAAGQAGRAALSPGRRGVIGAAFILYGVAYPLVGLATGLVYPRMPVFAVPCPTTLVTAGVLVGVAGVPRFVSVVPILWAVVGSSAAFVLGMRADLVLILAAIAMGIDAVTRANIARLTD